MNDTTVFLQEGAKFMSRDRPDLWPEPADAFRQLRSMFSYCAGEEESCSIGIGGFTLHKFMTNEGEIEYALQRNILNFTIFEEENETLVYDFTKTSQLVDIGLNIPEDLDNDSEV